LLCVVSDLADLTDAAAVFAIVADGIVAVSVKQEKAPRRSRGGFCQESKVI